MCGGFDLGVGCGAVQLLGRWSVIVIFPHYSNLTFEPHFSACYQRIVSTLKHMYLCYQSLYARDGHYFFTVKVMLILNIAIILNFDGVSKYSIEKVSQNVCLFVLLLYVPSQQLWSLRDGQFT